VIVLIHAPRHAAALLYATGWTPHVLAGDRGHGFSEKEDLKRIIFIDTRKL
jgi:hypothetical protein